MGTTTTRRREPKQSLADWRNAMGYTQVDACRALGCSRNAWASWESGRTKAPRYVWLACAALASGIANYPK